MRAPPRPASFAARRVVRRQAQTAPRMIAVLDLASQSPADPPPVNRRVTTPRLATSFLATPRNAIPGGTQHARMEATGPVARTVRNNADARGYDAAAPPDGNGGSSPVSSYAAIIFSRRT